MSHNAAMSEEAQGVVDRIQTRLTRLQAWGRGVVERIPPRTRRNGQRAFSFLFLILIGSVLYKQLKGTDWPEVLRSLPKSPWFYVLFLIRFFVMPCVDVLCYSAVWAVNLLRSFGVFLMKLILNVSVAGGAGDVYLMLWAVRTLRISYAKAFSGVKDVTLLSAAAANTVAIVVLGGYLAFGDLTSVPLLRPQMLGLIIGATLAAAVLSLFVILFRGKVLGVSTAVMWRILGYHSVRSGGTLILIGLQWTAGLPGSVFASWISLLMVELLVARTPFLPAREFVFLSLALAMAGTVDAPEAQVTALFLADTGLRQIMLVTSLLISLLWRTQPHSLPLDHEEGEAGVQDSK